MTEVLVVAPAGFGAEADAFVEAALRELGGGVSARGLVVRSGSEAARAVAGLRPGSLVLGSISSDLALEVAAAVRRRGLLHVEAGALSDRVLGPGTFRLTAGAAETAAAVLRMTAGRRFLVVAEESEFAAAVVGALRARTAGRPLAVRAVQQWLSAARPEPAGGSQAAVLVAVLRPPWPERLLERAAGVGEVIGAGSWARPEVGLAASAARVRLRFCDVMPARLLPAGELAPEVAASLAEHLSFPGSIYRDLGWASGLLIRQHLGEGGPAAWLASLERTWRETGFGHGIRFDARGQNRLAGKAILEWVAGELRLVARPATKEASECSSSTRG